MGVEKTIIKEGNGRTPKPGDKLSVHYTGKLTSDGSVFDSSHKRNKPFSFTIGMGQVISGMDEGVMNMKLGEKAVLKISSDYGYGARGVDHVIPPGAEISFEVELLKIN